MKSIKPGRGKSGLNAMAGIGVVLFGLFWTGMAAMITRGMGAMGFFFPLFGVIFVIVGIGQVIYNFKNATGKERFSIMDIVDKEEEGDPADRWISNEMASNGSEGDSSLDSDQFNYCPYCGYKLDSAYMYCPKCGKSVDS
ncbi:MAG: zinc ribbon domain-containing protein [Clostridia bacterium]|nr:zinc ribbon domain-containing protein [Clostridia bacterium]